MRAVAPSDPDPAVPPIRRRCVLIDADPDLAAGLTPDRALEARAIRTWILTGAKGPWSAHRHVPASAGHIGLLLLEGIVAREVAIEDTISSELLGPGDVIVPWSESQERGTAGENVRWVALAPIRAAVLDRPVAGALGTFPEIRQALLERLLVQGERLAALKAFSQINSVERRLTALFHHLADRWGRMTTRGVVVPLALSHRLLGELVGARRPTITVAVQSLARDGTLLREPNGEWLLPVLPALAPAGELPPVAHRRTLVLEPEPEPTPASNRALRLENARLRRLLAAREAAASAAAPAATA
jgi:CRP/FNR family transcriptional regulator, cyclic AMP receptor protein